MGVAVDISGGVASYSGSAIWPLPLPEYDANPIQDEATACHHRAEFPARPMAEGSRAPLSRAHQQCVVEMAFLRQRPLPTPSRSAALRHSCCFDPPTQGALAH